MRGVAVHLTINTMIREKELQEVADLVRAIGDSGIDAVIVQDLAVASLFDELAPHIPLHASTQMGIHNLSGALSARRLGFDLVVMSREALNVDIAEIREKTSLGIEIFAHGALCVSFSGNCYMSSFINGGSGNRGKCLQSCRLRYTAMRGNKKYAEGYLLSPADIATWDTTEDYAYVDSIKIEGRLKSPEYVYAVTRAYRRLLDTGRIDRDIRLDASIVFCRGFHSGYSHSDTRRIMSPSFAGHRGVYFAKVTMRQRDGSVRLQGSLPKVGDGVKLIRHGVEGGGGTVTALSGENVRIAGAEPSVGDELFVTSRRFDITQKPVTGSVYQTATRQVRPEPTDLPKGARSYRRIYEVTTAAALNGLDTADALVVLYPEDFRDAEAVMRELSALSARGLPVYLKPNNVSRGKDMTYLDRLLRRCACHIAGLYVSNYYVLECARRYDLPVLYGHEMNLANSRAISALGATQAVLSAELTEKDMMDIRRNTDAELYAYTFGYFPLMTLSHCPMQSSFGSNCSACTYTGKEVYRDRKCAFALRRVRSAHCYFKLLNSVPHNVPLRVKGVGEYIDLTAPAAVKAYRDVLSGKTIEHTNGHYKKEV